MKIYMVRHGQTDSNVAKKIMGQRIDESLNQEGRRQAHELSDSLKGTAFDVIFSSPLKRVLETAKVVAEGRTAKILTRDELKERDFGSLSGKTQQEAAEILGITVEKMRAADYEQKFDYRPFGGESAAEVRTRFLKFIEEVKRDYAGKRVLVVTHAGISRLAHLLFRESAVEHIKNATLEEFDI